MEIELTQNKKGCYEIWADKACIIQITQFRGETFAAYKSRALAEFEKYVEKMKSLRQGGTSTSVKKVTL